MDTIEYLTQRHKAKENDGISEMGLKPCSVSVVCIGLQFTWKSTVFPTPQASDLDLTHALLAPHGVMNDCNASGASIRHVLFA